MRGIAREGMVVAVFLCVLALPMAFVEEAHAHYDTAYWHETSQATGRSDWMAELPDDLRLSELSLPGTHDSMAYRDDLSFPDNVRTQTMDLTAQLNSGIRYIDIRAKHTDSGFPLHHGPVYLGYDFEDVLRMVREFLTAHPGETVVMRFKQEQSSASDRHMRDVFSRYYQRHSDLFWKSDGSGDPLLGDVRGKLVLLSDVLSLNDYGINYRNVFVQDHYNLGTNWDLYGKWEKVKAHALEADRTSGKLALNHLSAGSAGVMPYFAASGHSSPQTGAPRLLTGLTEPAFASYYPEFPRVGQLGALSSIAFEGMNTMFADLIESGRVANKTGMVAADFPGQRLIDAVIGCNPALGEDTSRYDHTTTVSYAVEVSGPSFGTAKATVTGSQDGKGFNWHATLTNQPTAYQFYSGYKQGSAGANFNGSAIPYVAEDWSVGGRPFALYVDGQQVAGSDKGGTVHHVTVLWEGVLQILGYSNYHVAGNVDLIVRTWDKDWNLVDTVYMPRGSDQRVCWGNWHILESWGDGVSRNGGTHTISLSTWEEVVSAPVPALSATQADGSPYVSGLWTNQGVEVDIAEETGYPRLFALQAYWYPDSVGNRHGLYREAPLNQRTLSFEETEETSGVGKILRACLYDTGNTGGHVWGDYLIVKIDKTNPTVEEATEDCVRAQDALSGLSEKAVFVADDGSKEAVDAMFDGKGAAFKVPESIRGKPYEVTVTDQAGNVARAAYAPGE